MRKRRTLGIMKKIKEKEEEMRKPGISG